LPLRAIAVAIRSALPFAVVKTPVAEDMLDGATVGDNASVEVGKFAGGWHRG
jgi:hypothetical protein